ncbi:UNVERIFIED_CONTAM: hypothetical protein K2H54_037495 [Gekko kuhli]
MPEDDICDSVDAGALTGPQGHVISQFHFQLNGPGILIRHHDRGTRSTGTPLLDSVQTMQHLSLEKLQRRHIILGKCR